MKLIHTFLVLALLSVVSNVYADSKGAVLEDIVLGAPYEVLAVDGKPPIRARHWIATVVPVVILPSGVHQLTVRRSNLEFDALRDTKTIDFQIEVNDGHRYRLGILNERPVINEVQNKP